MENTPAISVIIPLYNAEKYIAECLDSVLMQTFQDFEVIVVNDCATDNSRAIAESYLEKFGGRLKIFDNEQNSGPSASRNKGLRHATGEYIFFMDSDDLILLDALEKMYTLAKEYDVDFINSTRIYETTEDGKELNLQNVFQLKNITPSDEPLIEEDLQWRINGLLGDKFYYGPPRRFLRRNFLLDNQIFFPESFRHGEDQSWTHALMLRAKKVLHIALPFYIVRKAKDSITRTKREPLESIALRMLSAIDGVDYIDDFMKDMEIFEQMPKYRYAILEHYVDRRIRTALKMSLKIPQVDIYQAIKENYGEKFGKYAVLVAELCSLINDQQKEIHKMQAQL